MTHMLKVAPELTLTAAAKDTPPRTKWRGVPIAFVLPALALYLLVVVYPSIAGAVYAFTDWKGGGSWNFVGLANFTSLAADPNALGALANTLILSLAIVVVQSLIGLLLALALHANIKSTNVLRTLLFAPALLPPVIIAVLWQYLYSPGGPLDTVLNTLGMGWAVQTWLGDPSLSLGSVTVAIIWQHAGLSMVIFLAGLQGVPQQLYEAAAIDGAGKFRRFWSVTAPMIAPATTIVLALNLISSLKLFDQVFVMTNGGPGTSTQTLSLLMYREAFVFGKYGYGTAIALVLTMIVAACAFLQLKFTRRFEVEG